MPASAPAREVTNSHRSYRVAWETPRRWEPGRKGKFARVNDGFRTRDAVSAGRVPCVTQRAVRRPSLRGPLPPSAGGSGGPSSPRPHCRGARAPRGPLSGRPRGGQHRGEASGNCRDPAAGSRDRADGHDGSVPQTSGSVSVCDPLPREDAVDGETSSRRPSANLCHFPATHQTARSAHGSSRTRTPARTSG